MDDTAARIAAAIGEPARARMLYCLMDGRARTGTELAVIAEIGPSTASIHLSRLRAEHLVQVVAQGKHRYYSLAGAEVADVLEGLNVLAGRPRGEFAPNTPAHLRAARTCYDHIAGTLGVAIYDRFVDQRWISAESYELTPKGRESLGWLRIEASARRRFAYACLDWSERRAHLGGALGSAILAHALRRRWVTPDLDSRVLRVTSVGWREMSTQFGLDLGRDGRSKRPSAAG